MKYLFVILVLSFSSLFGQVTIKDSILASYDSKLETLSIYIKQVRTNLSKERAELNKALGSLYTLQALKKELLGYKEKEEE